MENNLNNLGYSFQDTKLLQLALTHKSYSGENNERLEFLGDSILNLYVSEKLFNSYSDLNEGTLTILKAGIVSRENLNTIASKIGIATSIKLGKGETLKNNSILGNTLEALVGAVFLDSNFDIVKTFLDNIFGDDFLDIKDIIHLKDPKSHLQEIVQKYYKSLPVYVTSNVSASTNIKKFEAVCTVKEAQLSSRGTGSNIKKAEQEAASEMLGLLTDE